MRAPPSEAREELNRLHPCKWRHVCQPAAPLTTALRTKAQARAFCFKKQSAESERSAWWTRTDAPKGRLQRTLGPINYFASSSRRPERDINKYTHPHAKGCGHVTCASESLTYTHTEKWFNFSSLVSHIRQMPARQAKASKYNFKNQFNA